MRSSPRHISPVHSTHCGFLDRDETARTVSLTPLFRLIVHFHDLTMVCAVPENHSDCLGVRNKGVSANDPTTKSFHNAGKRRDRRTMATFSTIKEEIPARSLTRMTSCAA